MMQLNKQHPTPIYLQLKEVLRSQIEQGVYFSHQKLPSERDLCQHYDLSRMTARRALQELIDDGLAYTKVGKGTFVSERPSTKKISTIAKNYLQGFDVKNGLTLDNAHNQLTEHLLNFETDEVEKLVNSCIATFSFEVVAIELFPSVIHQLEKLWHQNDIDLLTQNYALTTLRSHLTAMVNATATVGTGPKAILGAVLGDQHEMGLLTLALCLRQRGFKVIYIGPNINTAHLNKVMNKLKPDLVCISAATQQAAETTIEITRELYTQSVSQDNQASDEINQNALITFGGVAYSQNPVLVSSVSGIFLGCTIDAALVNIEKFFQI